MIRALVVPMALQCAELLQVFNGENVEGLSCDHRAYDERDGDGETKVNRKAGVADVIPDRHPSELVAGHRLKPRGGANAAAQFVE